METLKRGYRLPKIVVSGPLRGRGRKRPTIQTMVSTARIVPTIIRQTAYVGALEQLCI